MCWQARPVLSARVFYLSSNVPARPLARINHTQNVSWTNSYSVSPPEVRAKTFADRQQQRAQGPPDRVRNMASRPWRGGEGVSELTPALCSSRCSGKADVDPSVAEAIKVGYRHIDCALIYRELRLSFSYPAPCPFVLSSSCRFLSCCHLSACANCPVLLNSELTIREPE